MSYYTLPKKNIDIEFNPVFADQTLEPFISFSLHNYLQTTSEQIKIIEKSESFFSLPNESIIEFLNKIINPHEFIFTKVPNYKLSVSKLKPYSNMFYIMMEIVYIFNLLDSFAGADINTMCYGENSTSIIECLNILREEKKDVNKKSIINLEQIKNDGCEITNGFRYETYDFLYYELNDDNYDCDNYVIGMIYILCNLLSNQNTNGASIIKIDNIYYKPIVDILYILSSVYENISVIKPSTSNALTSERFIICKNFICNSQKVKLYSLYFANLNLLLKTSKKNKILSILKDEIPYYFVNKIEESNIIIGHQQLEYNDQMINLYKNKSREEKIEVLKKNNIQKCIQWCDKFKIPYNKFTEKVNIFLNNDKSTEETGNIFLSARLIEECEHVINGSQNFLCEKSNEEAMVHSND
jgi:hypothetical protein